MQHQTRGDHEEFERNFKNVVFEYLEYYKSVLSTIREEHLGFLFKKTFCSTQVGLAAQSEAQRQAGAKAETQVQAQTRIQTPLEQTLDHAIGVIANFSRLMLEPDCRHARSIIYIGIVVYLYEFHRIVVVFSRGRF